MMASSMIAFALLAIATVAAYASTRTTTKAPAPRPLAPTAARPPLVFQVNPTTLTPSVQPNILILGQNFTDNTVVEVGGHPATTIEADAYHLLVQLPSGLRDGTYQIVVASPAGTVTATDPLVVKDADGGINQTTLLAGAVFVVLLVLVMRLARTPSLS
jgi:ABC-type phosphate/phosphonate transport system substrate-binding protein